jgi:MarR family transcriptional regulator for hemolysin
MEAAGLITRTRDPANRRVHQVELTEAGEAMFQRLLGAVTAFDQKLRRGLSNNELDRIGSMLNRLRANTSAPEDTH